MYSCFVRCVSVTVRDFASSYHLGLIMLIASDSQNGFNGYSPKIGHPAVVFFFFGWGGRILLGRCPQSEHRSSMGHCSSRPCARSFSSVFSFCERLPFTTLNQKCRCSPGTGRRARRQGKILIKPGVQSRRSNRLQAGELVARAAVVDSLFLCQILEVAKSMPSKRITAMQQQQAGPWRWCHRVALSDIIPQFPK